ncbi:MAG: hypothetical protein K2M90_02600, partial [Treponemataceae bacterium]|nr:hypothetical protein [Treponemataceae bacterium]
CCKEHLLRFLHSKVLHVRRFCCGNFTYAQLYKKKAFKQALCGKILCFFAKIPAERVPAAGGMREG